jgi:hypothetical protein
VRYRLTVDYDAPDNLTKELVYEKIGGALADLGATQGVTRVEVVPGGRDDDACGHSQSSE